MATAAVLRSENCLNGRYHLDAFRSRPPPPPKTHRKKPKSNNRRSPPPHNGKTISGADSSPKKALVMENIKILKRGEDLNALAADPEILERKLGLVDLSAEYAGPAFFVSPEPSALPMPGFLARNDDVATRSLRCVLGLN